MSEYLTVERGDASAGDPLFVVRFKIKGGGWRQERMKITACSRWSRLWANRPAFQSFTPTPSFAGFAKAGELEHLRARFERLRTMANTHTAEIDEWSQRVGRPLCVPRIAFPWPPAPALDALLETAVEAPELVWDDDPRAASA